MDSKKKIMRTFLVLLVMLGLSRAENADCSTAATKLQAIESEMTTHEGSGNLCMHTMDLSTRLIQLEHCTDQFVSSYRDELWNQLIIQCQDSLKGTDPANPLQCRKERCMITPEMENATESEDGNVDFDELPSNLLRRLLDAFGTTGLNEGTRKRRAVAIGPKTLFDDDLKAIGNLIVADQSQLENFNPLLVCDILEELDLKKMLECIVDQKTVLKCDGDINIGSEGYDVDANAKKLSGICSKTCINIPPAPYRLCHSQKPYHMYLQDTQDAVTMASGVEEACRDMQQNYFDCLTEASRCCDQLTGELDTHFSAFMTQQYGGLTCTNMTLNKMTDCSELNDETTEEPDSDNDTTEKDNETPGQNNDQNNEDGDPNAAPASDGNGATGKSCSLWMVLVITLRCVTLFQS